MKYILDTNICIYWLKGNENIEKNILSVGTDNISISFINLSELYYGAYKSQKVDENVALVERLSGQVNVIQSDEAISATF